MATIINERDSYLQGGTRTSPFALILSHTITKYNIEINAVNTSSIVVSSYIYKLGSSWATAAPLATIGSSTYNWEVQAPGIYTVWCVAKDINGNESTPVSTEVIITAPGFSDISSLINGPNLKLTWTISQSDFVIDRYEIRYGNTWEAPEAVVVATTYSTTYIHRVDYVGSRIWWVAAISIAKNIDGTLIYSTPKGVNVTINSPSQVSNIQASIVDNNVLLSWNEPVIGTNQVPIASYVVKRGTVYASSVVVGSNGNSNFTSIFEQTGGTYIYWVVAIDTAGNEGEPLQKTVVVNQPPDYVLRNNYNSPFTSGTSTNFYVENGSLIGPVVVNQNWNYHFSSQNWTTPQEQINAGFPIYATPSTTTGTYEETIDYGAEVPPTVLTATITAEAVSGTVTNTCVISHKLLVGDPWTVLAANTTNVLLPKFRFIRVQYTFTAAAGSNLVKITGLNIKLAIKQRTDSGTAVYDSTKTDAQNFVSFTYPFLYADTPIIQANNTIAIIPVVVYNGNTANPTGFSVRLYNRSGTPTSSSYSWSVRGY